MAIYVTSDLHLGHDRDFIFGPRGFTNVDDHDRTIIKNWNSVVKDGDTVYLLGDLMLGDNEKGIEKLKQLKGTINIVLGNHDSKNRIEMYKELGDRFHILGYKAKLRYKKYDFLLSHYPTITTNINTNWQELNLHKEVINLCGHSHTKNKFKDLGTGLVYHVELDAHNNKPVSLDTVIADLEDKFN